MQDFTFALIAVVAFAVVQSVFGMGLLVFGTPTLLLLGHSFGEALSWLLPPSAMISLLQVFEAPERAKVAWRDLKPLWCVAILVPVLGICLSLQVRFRLELPIGLAMCAASAFRLSQALRDGLRGFIERSERGYLVAMGALHGLTNMGGTLLSIYAAATMSGKDAVRSLVANYYLVFVVFQLAVIAFIQPQVLTWRSLISAVVGLTVYCAIGRRVFSGFSGILYDRALTSFIALYGVALLARSHL